MVAVQREVELKIGRATKPKAAPKVVAKVDPPAFRDHDTGKVIKGLPAPMPCPFCKRTNCTVLNKGRSADDDPSFVVECGYCGTESPFAPTQLEAAKIWNNGLGGVNVARHYALDNLSIRARSVLLRGLKTVLDNSHSDEEFAEAQFLSGLLADFSPPQPKRKQFIDIDDSAPIEGLPEPAPCPFCGFHEWTGIVTTPEEVVDGIRCDASYHVQCDGCHAEGPSCDSKLAAAEGWNKAAKKVDYSIIEALDSINLKLTHLSDMLVMATDKLRDNAVDIDAPVATCLEAALDSNLEVAREGVEALLKKLSTWKSPALERLALTG